MYLVAQRVAAASQRALVNVFKYVHDASWRGEPPLGVPKQRPGRCVLADRAAHPGANRIVSYLDVTYSDDLAPDTVRNHLAFLKRGLVESGNPTSAMVGPLLVEYYRADERVPWKVELGALAGHLLLRGQI